MVHRTVLLGRDQFKIQLFKTEMQNLAIYGFGAKSFMLSMIETAIRISDGKIPVKVIEKIIEYGKALLDQPIELLDHPPSGQ